MNSATNKRHYLLLMT